MKQILSSWLLSLMLLASINAQADPKTKLRFDLSLEGLDSGGRFGAEIACSRRVFAAGNNSIIAIAAPDAAAGQGRVYIFDPVNSTSAQQVLSPAGEQTATRFGAAIQFLDDINEDGVDDLIVGAPGSIADIDGGVYLFRSVISEAGVRYALCGLVQGPQGFGERVQAVRKAGGSSAANVVIANPRLARIDGFALSVQSNSTCQFTAASDFSETFAPSSAGGSSISQVGSRPGLTQGSARIFVAVPYAGEFGVIYERAAAEVGLQTPVAAYDTSLEYPELEHAGAVVSGEPDSSTYVIGVPRAYRGRGSLAVYQLDAAGAQLQCIVNNPQEEYSGLFGSNVRHLGQSFLGLFTSAQQVVALRSAESSTGGSLGFVSVTANGCSDLIPVNNCLNDARQEQGFALAGGADCQAFINGSLQRLLISGSPGWSGQRGRVDIAFEQGVLDMTYSCSVMSALTLTPIAGAYDGDSQRDESWVLTPTPTPTPIPIFIGLATVPSTATALPTDSITEAFALAGDTISAREPVVVAPGLGRLPTPSVVVRPGEVEVELPQVRPQLSLQQQLAVRRKLKKQRRISKRKATQLRC